MTTVSLESFRPKLTPNARVEVRSDGSCGVFDEVTGRSLEVAKDQATLLTLIDGERTVPQIVEAHYAEHRFVPFAALDDLLRALATAGLLDTSAGPIPVATRKRNWMQRLYVELAHPRIPGAAFIGVIVALASVVIPLVLRPTEEPPLTPWSVLWVYPGAMLALSLRRFFQSAGLLAFRERPTHFEIGLTAGVLHLGPDTDGLVLLDRGRRARIYILGLVGCFVAHFIGHHYNLGISFGAFAIMLADACPFAPTSMGRLLATLAGKVDLREHARAYLDRRILRRAVNANTFEGEGSLILSLLLSLAWIGLLTRLLMTKGLATIMKLLAIALDSTGVERALAYGGAAVLTLLIPASLALLVATVIRAFLSLRPPAAAASGTKISAEQSRANLAMIPLFSRLPPDELAALAKAGEELHYAPGNQIVVQGEQGDRFFAILSGEVAVEHEADSGLIREVARLAAGDCFGETAILEGGVRTATVRAVSETTVLSLSRDAFERMRSSLDGAQVSAVLRASAALRKSAFFGSLQGPRLSAIALKLEPRRVQRGDVVIKYGEPGDDFFLVSEGSLEVLDAEGQTIATLGPGDHFGEVALLRDVPRTATVRAMANSLILALKKGAFLNAIAADLALSSRIEAFAAERAEGQ